MTFVIIVSACARHSSPRGAHALYRSFSISWLIGIVTNDHHETPCVTIQPSSAAPTPFRAAASRLAGSPTAALALDLAAKQTGRIVASRLSPAAGSFDPPTAAALSTRPQP